MSKNKNQGNVIGMPIDGLLRLTQIVGKKGDPERNMPTIQPIIPISKTSFLDGVKTGKYPKPVRLGERTVAWRVADIRKVIEQA
jgi:predicted DNA-binding transcriptional regulator AlpA